VQRLVHENIGAVVVFDQLNNVPRPQEGRRRGTRLSAKSDLEFVLAIIAGISLLGIAAIADMARELLAKRGLYPDTTDGMCLQALVPFFMVARIKKVHAKYIFPVPTS
jgi:hypothetical protein